MTISDKYLAYTGTEETHLRRCLDNGKLSGTSDMIKLYEEKLKTYWGSKNALAVSSGTAALVTALNALGISAGDEVIVSVLAPIMSALPIIQVGAVPVFADSQKDSFDFDYDELPNLISSKTKAILAVPIYGYPFDYQRLRKVCKENGLYLIEDAAQAHGSALDGKLLGTFGDVGCFSTHDRKILSTGEGGFLLTDNGELYERANAFIQFDHMSGERFGTNYKLSSLQAAIGISRIAQIDWQIERRNANVKYFFEHIAESERIRDISVPSGSRLNYYSLVLVFSQEIHTAEIVTKLDDCGIPSDVLKYKFVPLYERRIFKDFYISCPNAETLCRRLTTIPVHPAITRSELDYMSEKILFCLNSYKSRR